MEEKQRRKKMQEIQQNLQLLVLLMETEVTRQWTVSEMDRILLPSW